MASVSKCPYCGADVRSDEKNCPGCGAPNELYVTETPAPAALRPKTMAELLDFAAQRRMPLEKMRFFVGRDYREPKAFGIYRDARGNFIVYKNKSNSERSIRYSGPDEARAVGELYDKLLSECRSRGIDPENPSSGHSSHSGRPIHYDPSSLPSQGSSSSRGRQRSSKPKIAIVIFVLFFLLFFSKGCNFSLGGGSGYSSGYGSGYSSGYDSGYSSGYDYYDSDDDYSSGYSSWDDDDDWDDDWDWDDDDTDWDSDW